MKEEVNILYLVKLIDKIPEWKKTEKDRAVRYDGTWQEYTIMASKSPAYHIQVKDRQGVLFHEDNYASEELAEQELEGLLFKLISDIYDSHDSNHKNARISKLRDALK